MLGVSTATVTNDWNITRVWLRQEMISEPDMKMIFRLLLLVGLLCGGLSVSAQQPVLNYTLAINPADTSSVQITMRVRNLPKTFHLAMVNHFLVDDGYWRFVEDLPISPGTINEDDQSRCSRWHAEA